MQQRNLNIENEKISSICKKYYVQKLSLFGSTLHGSATEQSDVDILVEFLPNHTPGFSFISLQDELSATLGRTVDLHTAESISKYFRNDVVKEAQAIYGIQ